MIKKWNRKQEVRLLCCILISAPHLDFKHPPLQRKSPLLQSAETDEERFLEEADQQLERLNLDKFVIMPDSSFRLYWDMVMMILVIFYGVEVPIRIAFTPPSDDIFTTTIDTFSNIFFLLGSSGTCTY